LLYLVSASISQTHNSIENSQDFFVKTKTKTFTSRPRPRPRLYFFCPRGASRPRLWSRGLHHWIPRCIYTVSQKIRATLIFMTTSANVDQFLLFFSLLNSERICGKRRN